MGKILIAGNYEKQHILYIVFYFGYALTQCFQKENPKQFVSESSKDPRRSLVFGVKGGFNRSNVFDEKGQSFVASPKVGFAGGAFLCIPVGRFLGLQPEVLVSQKGFRSTGAINNVPYDLERTTTFLDVPLQIQFKPFDFVSLVGGVQYSYLMNQQDRFTNGNSTIEQNQEFNNDNIYRNIFGVVAGLDVHVKYFVLSGRVGWDLTENRGDGSSFTPKYKNVWLQGTVGFRIY